MVGEVKDVKDVIDVKDVKVPKCQSERSPNEVDSGYQFGTRLLPFAMAVPRSSHQAM